MKLIINQLTNFLRSPKLQTPKEKVRIKDFLVVVLLYFIGLSVMAVITHLTTHVLRTQYGIDLIEQTRQNIGLLKENLGWWLVPAIWWIIPILKELMFRLTLIKSRKNLIIAVFSYPPDQVHLS